MKTVLRGLAAAELQGRRYTQAGVYALILYQIAKNDPCVLGLNAKFEEARGENELAKEFINEAKQISSECDLDLNGLTKEGLK